MTLRIGFVGLGTMGAPMANNLLKAGFELTVHNRTRHKEEPLAELGASRAASPMEAAEGADLIMTIVSDTPDVEEVLFGSNGVADVAAAGSTVVEMSTIDPVATKEFSERLAAKGIGMVDAPVSGGSEGAEAGTLSVMCGGAAEDFEKALPALEAVGKTITHIGPSGAGQMTKALNQVIIAGTLLAVAEGVTLGMAAGLDMDKVLPAVGAGAAGSWALTNRGPRMVADHYPLGFRLALHLKDMGIALKAARDNGVELRVAALAAELEKKLIAAGYGDEDVSAIARAVKGLGEAQRRRRDGN